MKSSRPPSAFFAAPRQPARWTGASKLLGCALTVSLATGGCLSDRYRISDEELARQVQLPPEQRGQKVRVVQEIGSRAAPPASPNAPPPGYGNPPPGYSDGYHSHTGVYVGMNMGPSYYGPGPGYSRGPTGGSAAGLASRSGGGGSAAGLASGAGGASAASGGLAADGRPVTQAGPSGPASVDAPAAAPAPTSAAGAAGAASSAPKGNSTDDAKALAVVAVVLALTAVVGVAATEGARYDGEINVTPYQNIYLKDRQGTERLVALGDLTPRDLIGVKSAEISDAEGYGIQRLGRAPLNRKGFTFKLDGGSLSTRVENRTVAGAGANIQLGYFFNKKLGLLATTTLTGGEDNTGRGYIRTQYGAEIQGFLPGLGPVHLGGFGQGAFATTAIDNAGSRSGNVLSTGGILEVELTTRLALMLRGGYSWSNISGSGWSPEGLGITVGLAIY